MSYNPAQAIGAKAIIIYNMDTNPSSQSPDIITGNFTTFNARCKYYMETKAFFNVSSTTSGFLYYHNWSGFTPFGSLVRGNLVSGTSSGLDDVCIGSNTPKTLLIRSETNVGSASMGTRLFSNQIWRIL
jgi:hypothetical protein